MLIFYDVSDKPICILYSESRYALLIDLIKIACTSSLSFTGAFPASTSLLFNSMAFFRMASCSKSLIRIVVAMLLPSKKNVNVYAGLRMNK